MSSCEARSAYSLSSTPSRASVPVGESGCDWPSGIAMRRRRSAIRNVKLGREGGMTVFNLKTYGAELRQDEAERKIQ